MCGILCFGLNMLQKLIYQMFGYKRRQYFPNFDSQLKHPDALLTSCQNTVVCPHVCLLAEELNEDSNYHYPTLLQYVIKVETLTGRNNTNNIYF